MLEVESQPKLDLLYTFEMTMTEVVSSENAHFRFGLAGGKLWYVLTGLIIYWAFSFALNVR